jgi:hypothetical protein
MPSSNPVGIPEVRAGINPSELVLDATFEHLPEFAPFLLTLSFKSIKFNIAALAKSIHP